MTIKITITHFFLFAARADTHHYSFNVEKMETDNAAADEMNNNSSFLGAAAVTADADEDFDEDSQCYSPTTRRSIGDFLHRTPVSDSGNLT